MIVLSAPTVHAIFKGVIIIKENWVEKECVICQTKFTTNLANARGRNKKTCGSNSCSSKLGAMNSKKTNTNCKICNKSFEITQHKIMRNGNYCSDICRKYSNINNCVICNESFKSDRNSTKYCSDNCRKYGVNSKLGKTNCACCGIDIIKSTFKIPKNKRHFCSNKCRNLQFTRENPNRYGKTWWKIRDTKVKKHDYTCVKCNEQHLEPYGIQVHHIIPISKFENVDDAHYEDNLLTLCNACHELEHVKDIYS